MALNKSTTLIRDYENIRSILRDIYIYGCFSRDDYVEKLGISGRKYDKEQLRINTYLPHNFIKKRRVDKKTLLYCHYNFADSCNNYLADTYRNKSFTSLDIMSFFYVQQLLNETCEMTAGDILESIPMINDNVIFTKDNLRIKLEELEERGYIKSEKKNNKVIYSLTEDIWRDFSNEELKDIYIYLDFLRNVSSIEMPYYFLFRKLKLYLKNNRKTDAPEISFFQFKHNHLFNSLDNDILLKLLKTLKEEKIIEITLYGKKKKQVIMPIEIIEDSMYGRQYVYCIDNTIESEGVIRIDRIKEVAILRNATREEKQQRKDRVNYYKECWCTSGAGKEMNEIRIRFSFNEETERYILRRIQNEGQGGKLEKTGNGIYEYTIRVRDPNEMVPWIRSFGEYAKVIESGMAQTEKVISADWKLALKKYESI